MGLIHLAAHARICTCDFDEGNLDSLRYWQQKVAVPPSHLRVCGLSALPRQSRPRSLRVLHFLQNLRQRFQVSPQADSSNYRQQHPLDCVHLFVHVLPELFNFRRCEVSDSNYLVIRDKNLSKKSSSDRANTMLSCDY